MGGYGLGRLGRFLDLGPPKGGTGLYGPTLPTYLQPNCYSFLESLPPLLPENWMTVSMNPAVPRSLRRHQVGESRRGLSLNPRKRQVSCGHYHLLFAPPISPNLTIHWLDVCGDYSVFAISTASVLPVSTFCTSSGHSPTSM